VILVIAALGIMGAIVLGSNALGRSMNTLDARIWPSPEKILQLGFKAVGDLSRRLPEGCIFGNAQVAGCRKSCGYCGAGDADVAEAFSEALASLALLSNRAKDRGVLGFDAILL
jgi:hypothetical protein